MNNKNKILLVDGHVLLFQMFYGMPSRIVGKNGKSIHAVIGFTGALLKMIRIMNPSHVLVIFDGENGTNKVELDKDYKANRIDYSTVKEEDNPFSQLGVIKEVLNYLNIKHYDTLDENETDDHIASYVKKYKKDSKIYIASKDTDFLQLIDDNVSVYMYYGKNSINYTYDKVIEKYNIKPSDFAFYKALVGDNTDNIKGVSKIGPKTAVNLINEYGTLENMLEKINSILKLSIRNAIESNQQRIIKNLELIKLSRDVNMPFELKDIAFEFDEELSTMVILRKLNII